MSYRVVQWATGNQGVEAIRAILDRPDLELVGAKVYGDDKDGVDAGVLAGRQPCGVLATRDVDEILALGADCVAYFPRHASLDEVCRILASGANVATTAFLFHPRSLPADDLARLEAACAEGDSSVHGTGLNPGNLSGVLPLALSGMSRSDREGDPLGARRLVVLRVDPHHVRQHALRASARGGQRGGQRLPAVQQRDLPGGGGPDRRVARRRPRRTSPRRSSWSWPSRTTRSSGSRCWPAPSRVSDGTGGACGPGRCLVEIETLWTVGGEYPSHWPTPLDGWTLTLEGEPSIRAHLLTLMSYERPLPLAEHVRAASVATAMQAINAIPALCEAPAGDADHGRPPPGARRLRFRQRRTEAALLIEDRVRRGRTVTRLRR